MRIRVAHVSLEFGDSDKQHTHDIEKIFERAEDRRYAWVMGTESGPGSGNTGKELLRVGRDTGYRMYVPSEQSKGGGRATDCWIAVRKDLVKSGWKTRFIPVIPGSGELYKRNGVKEEFPKWGPKGLVTANFQSIPELGEISLVAMHHLTKGATKGPHSVIHGIDHYALNMEMDAKCAEWVAKVAEGSALAFGSLDRNASDRRTQVNIAGTTTLADELKKWQNTGHGDIDWIFSTNKDRRVTGVNYRVLDDREFFLHTDHFFLEGVFNVEPLKS